MKLGTMHLPQSFGWNIILKAILFIERNAKGKIYAICWFSIFCFKKKNFQFPLFDKNILPNLKRKIFYFKNQQICVETI